MINRIKICAPVLLNVLNLLRKSDKMQGKPHILSFFPTRLINSIKHEHSCKILYKRFEPVHEISNIMVCATSKASDQPAHTQSLIRAFASCLIIL